MSRVGIDFGMENIKVSVLSGKVVRSMNLDGTMGDVHIAPNVVYYSLNEKNVIEQYFFGSKKAYKGRLLNSPDYIRHSKRLLQKAEWKQEICGGAATVTVERVVRDILEEVKKRVYQETRDPEIEAVMTIPVCFAEFQKQRLIWCAENAGIKVSEILTEPFAALFSDDIQDSIGECDEEKKIIVFDLGGSTLDICLASVSRTKDKKRIEIVSSTGMQFGGVDITKQLYESIKSYFAQEIEDDLRNGSTWLVLDNFFYKEIEECKKLLYNSDAEEEDMAELDFGGKKMVLYQKDFNDVLEQNGIGEKIRELFDNMFKSVSEEEDEDIGPECISEVFMIGGTSRITYFQDLIRNYFGKKNIIDKNILEDEVNLYNSVANGAAAFWNCATEYEIIQKAPMSIGIDRGKGFEIVLNKNVSYGERSGAKMLPFQYVQQKKGLIQVYQSVSDALIYGDCYSLENPEIVFAGMLYLDLERYDASKDIGMEFYYEANRLMVDIFQLTSKGEKQQVERQPLFFVNV